MAAVDLRPMSIGEVLDRTFFLYKKNFWLFVGILALPLLLQTILSIGVNAIQRGNNSNVFTATHPGQAPVFNTGLLFTAIATGLLFLVITMLVVGAAQAATIFAVSDLYLGRPTSVRGAYSRVGRKALRVLIVLFFVFLALFVGMILLVVPFFILLCRTAVAVPVAMLEDTKAIRSIERSMELTKGFWAPIFLIFLLVWTLSYVATIIFQVPFLILTFTAARAHHTLSFGMMVLQNLATFISSVLVGPIGTIAFSLMYYNLRVRKEAFDVQHLMESMAAQPAAVNPVPAN